MDNATPLKKTKNKPKKFLIFGNILLLLVLISVSTYYMYTKRIFIFKGKAGCAPLNKLVCRRDDSSVCSDQNSNPLWGRYCDGTGILQSCNTWDACAPLVYEGQSCGGLTRFSSLSGTFVGCCNQQNCICANGVSTVTCQSNAGGQSCNWNPGGCGNPPQDTPIPTPTSPEISSTPTPTPTPEISNTPTPTTTPTPTVTPVLSSTPTPTATPGPSSTPGPTATPIPVPCGTKDCDDKTNPCRSGYICVQAHDGSNYCSSPDFATACKVNPSFNSCCTAPGAPTATPTTAATIAPTKTASVPSVGTTPWGAFGIIGAIILVGLLL